MQHPRVCFTDIPIELLAEHGQRYGKYGVGFRRETIIDWGGLPVWYLPNLFMALLSFRGISTPSLAAQGEQRRFSFFNIRRDDPQVAHSIFMVLSFIKEMSPQSAEDHSYLFEREWRIVAGLTFAGQPSPFRNSAYL